MACLSKWPGLSVKKHLMANCAWLGRACVGGCMTPGLNYRLSQALVEQTISRSTPKMDGRIFKKLDRNEQSAALKTWLTFRSKMSKVNVKIEKRHADFQETWWEWSVRLPRKNDYVLDLNCLNCLHDNQNKRGIEWEMLTWPQINITIISTKLN